MNARAAFAASLCSVVLLAVTPAATEEAPSCAARIAGVMAGIAARDLDTSRGPPLNAFLTLNPYAIS